MNSRFIIKYYIIKFKAQQNIFNETLCLLNIKRIKPILFQLVMDNQMK